MGATNNPFRHLNTVRALESLESHGNHLPERMHVLTIFPRAGCRFGLDSHASKQNRASRVQYRHLTACRVKCSYGSQSLPLSPVASIDSIGSAPFSATTRPKAALNKVRSDCSTELRISVMMTRTLMHACRLMKIVR